MPIGIVSFFHVRKGFGHIKTDGYPTGIFVHFRDVKSSAKILVPNELVQFDIKQTAKGLQARNVKRMGKRLMGRIQQYEQGKGMILSEKNRQVYTFHHGDVAGNGFKHIRQGQLVEFSPFVDEPFLEAKEVIIADTRIALRQYALLPNWTQQLTHLQQLAEPEPWSLKVPSIKPKLLINYIEETFRWAWESDHSPCLIQQGEWSCFHTGLYSSSNSPIYGLFRRLPDHQHRQDYLTPAAWGLKGFFESHHRILDHFTQLPLHPAGTLSPTLTIMDLQKRWVIDGPHILAERQSRFPKSWQQLARHQQIDLLERAIDHLRGSFRHDISIPQWYQQTVQFLLPLSLRPQDAPSLALVLAPHQETYRIQTVLPLEWAYQNARLMGKQTDNWLYTALFLS